MAKWKIELHRVGREKATGTIFVEAANLVKAKQHTLHECRKHLSGGGAMYLEARGHYTYALILGLDEAGEVRITCLGACPSGTAYGS